MRVSHETIYPSLFVQARGALRKELTRSTQRQTSTNAWLAITVTSTRRSVAMTT
jgi:hypothetical protein